MNKICCQLNELDVDLTKHQLVFWSGNVVKIVYEVHFVIAISFNLCFAIHTGKYICVVDVETLLLRRFLYSIIFLSFILSSFILLRDYARFCSERDLKLKYASQCHCLYSCSTTNRAGLSVRPSVCHTRGPRLNGSRRDIGTHRAMFQVS